MRILLLSMPFGSVDRPALGLSLLKAGLARAGHQAEVGYPYEYLLRRIGLENYRWLTDDIPYTIFAGDWCFAEALYGPARQRDAGYVQNILLREWDTPRADILRMFGLRKHVKPFLRDVMSAYDWKRYNMVGFTSTFAQNIASLAFARDLKAAHPQLKIAFGGANWEDVMGEALFAAFPFVDYVCRGEADISLPELATALDNSGDLSGIPGLLWRNGRGAPQMQITDMDALPYPDMSDYFTMLSRSAPGVVPTMLMETSRGCWWGAKHHCTFCGLNGQTMAFRSKSPDRALDEIEALTRDNDCQFLSMVDNILDMKYFQNLIPALAERHDIPSIFFETKANLSRAQIQMLAKANIRTLQPGVESLSNPVLKLMRKGTNALRNVQLLKWTREYGVSIEWNVLYHFPGECDADYTDMLAIMPLLTHLQPPSGAGPVRIDRFAPYHSTPDAFGLGALKPLKVFEYLYPDAGDRLGDIVSYFEPADPPKMASAEVVNHILAIIENWRNAHDHGLWVRDDGRGLTISDSRHSERAELRLEGADRAIYILCDGVETPGKLVQELDVLGYGRFAEQDVVGFLDKLVDAQLMLRSDGSYLALGLYHRFPARPVAQRHTELIAGE